MSDAMPTETGPAEMFSLLNREMVHLRLPALRLAGLPEPLTVHLDFDTASVDEMLERLTVLRAQMIPAPTRN